MLKYLLSLFVIFTSCATHYQLIGFTGGYSETQLDERTYRVNFRGNGFTSMERAIDFCLLRSAELAILNGFSHFIIIDERSSVSVSSYTTPQSSNTSTTTNTFDNSSYSTAITTTYGGHTFHISKPRTSNLILCFKEQPNLNVFVYNAKFLYKSIKRKYNIKEK